MLNVKLNVIMLSVIGPLALPHKHKTRLERLARDKHSIILTPFYLQLSCIYTGEDARERKLT